MEKIKKAIYEGVGHASTCWKPDTGSAVFDDQEATKVSEKILAAVEEYADRTAFERVFKRIREDKELFYAYQSNIAMPFKYLARQKEEFRYISFDDLHDVANEAAKQFLSLLTRENTLLAGEEISGAEYLTTDKSEGGAN